MEVVQAVPGRGGGAEGAQGGDWDWGGGCEVLFLMALLAFSLLFTSPWGGRGGELYKVG